MHRTYNPAKRVNARPEGPNPSGPAKYYHAFKVKVEEQKFDDLLGKLFKSKHEPRTGGPGGNSAERFLRAPRTTLHSREIPE
jgi:hypothetical protein